MIPRILSLAVLLAMVPGCRRQSAALPPVFPTGHWEHVSPEKLGMSSARLRELQDVVQSNGFVVRHGYNVWKWGAYRADNDRNSSTKVVLSTLMLSAVADGTLRGVDQPVADFEPRLASLNGGKDAAITWRHFASQTSGYGLAERPGEAFAYNDYATALYSDTLMEKVFHSPPDQVLRERLAVPLGFEDLFGFETDGPHGLKGHLRASSRDFARLGLMMLREGRWGARQIVRADLIREMLHSPVSPALPLTSNHEAAMLPEQRTFGASNHHDCLFGPGRYSFNWWLNLPDKTGRKLLPGAPDDTIFVTGAWGTNALILIPSLDVVVAWSRSPINDQRLALTQPSTKLNRAVQLIKESVVDPAK